MFRTVFGVNKYRIPHFPILKLTPDYHIFFFKKFKIPYKVLLLLLLLLLLSRFSHAQLCATPIDGSPTGSPVPGILQARTLEWVGISFSNAWKWKVKVKSLSRVRLFATPWTAAYQAPLSMGFSRQEYWSGVPLPSPCSYPIHIKPLIQTKILWSKKDQYFWVDKQAQKG